MDTTVSSVTSGTTTDTTSSVANDALGKDEFLQLLVTQLSYQDPMEPMSNEDFSAQMAQFSSLEQMTQMNESMSELNETMSALNTRNAIVEAAALIGKEVIGVDSDTEATVSGKVGGVMMLDNVPILDVEGQALALSDVVHIVSEEVADNG